MRRTHHVHTHPCSKAEIGCTHRVPCGGQFVRNPDGEPGTICLAFHLDGGRLADVACQECEVSTCPDCGAVTRLEPHEDDCNYEPADDPDAWAGGFAVNH